MDGLTSFCAGGKHDAGMMPTLSEHAVSLIRVRNPHTQCMLLPTEMARQNACMHGFTDQPAFWKLICLPNCGVHRAQEVGMAAGSTAYINQPQALPNMRHACGHALLPDNHAQLCMLARRDRWGWERRQRLQGALRGAPPLHSAWAMMYFHQQYCFQRRVSLGVQLSEEG